MKSIILAGGSGTHLWPLSREQFPKQFLKLGKFSSFQDTFFRCMEISNIDEIFVVTNDDLKFYVIGQIEELGYKISWNNILIEPEGKNTLPAICYGMKTISEKFKESTVGIFPSDHIISKKAMQTITEAESLANNGYIITFGINPTSPSKHYGYIKGKQNIGIGKKITKFREKPNKKTAKKYIEKGYVWNSGIFLLNTKCFYNELKKHAPQPYKKFQGNNDVKETYKQIPPISFDYGIMEKTKQGVIVPLNYKWNDLDNYSDLYQQLPKNENGNVIQDGELLSINSENDLIYANNNKLISLIDVQDMIVIDRPDVLFIASKNSSCQVNEIVKQLKEKKDNRVIIGPTVYRPWGYYTVLESSKNHVIKKICVFPNRKISLQLHYHRSEHWVVVSGTAEVELNGKTFFIRPNESTFISAGEKHRIFNPSSTIPLKIIEVQLGEYISENDIVRFDDKYGRK